MAISPVCGESHFTIDSAQSQPLSLWSEGAFTTGQTETWSERRDPFMANNGEIAGGNPTAIADLDNDGNLDVYVGLNGSPNELFRYCACDSRDDDDSNEEEPRGRAGEACDQ